MTWFAAMTTGMGLGLAYFGGLWLTIRWLLPLSGGGVWWVFSQVARMTLSGAAFYAVGREGAGLIIWMLAGFLFARRCWLSEIGGAPHGR
jgi:F1F0 ATPase subunit 2